MFYITIVFGLVYLILYPGIGSFKGVLGWTAINQLEEEEQAAKVLDISVDTVINRSRTLLKRAKVGRTGVFIKRELVSDETFELALKKLADTNPAVRRRLRSTNRS